MNNNLIDTHCHLSDPQYTQEEISIILNECQKENIKLVTMSTDLEDFQKNLKFINYENIRIGLGIHPYEAHKIITNTNWQNQILQTLQTNKPNIHIIGEIGIDLYKYSETEKEQIEVFEFFVELAKQNDLAMSIHCRSSPTKSAEKIIIETLKKHQTPTPLKAIFHCFTSTNKQIIHQIIENEWYFGIGGIITFKKSKDLQEAVKYIHKNGGKIICETDSPYLSPEPLRSKKNYPQNVKIIYKFLQELLQTPTPTSTPPI